MARSSSPGLCRLENRIEELEHMLEVERNTFTKEHLILQDLQQQLSDSSSEIELLQNHLMTETEVSRRKDIELQKVKNKLKNAQTELEDNERTMKGKLQTFMAQYKDDSDRQRKQILKLEREKETIFADLEEALTQVDSITRSKNMIENKLDASISKLEKSQNENAQLSQKADTLYSEKCEILNEKSKIDEKFLEVEQTIFVLNKSKANLNNQIDELKSNLLEKEKNELILHNQISDLKTEAVADEQRYDEVIEENLRIKSQVSRLTNDSHTWKSKYDKEVTLANEEVEQLKRKLSVKTLELTEEADRHKNRAFSLEKSKQQLLVEIRDANSQIERANQENNETRLQINDLERELDSQRISCEELELEVESLKSNNSKLNCENKKLKASLEVTESRVKCLDKEKKLLTDTLNEAEESLQHENEKNLKQEALRLELQLKCRQLEESAEDYEVAKKDFDARVKETSYQLLQLKSETESRLLEKDAELESVKKSFQRTIESIHCESDEKENRLKSENLKIRKQLTSEKNDLQQELDGFKQSEACLLEENENLSSEIAHIQQELNNQIEMFEAKIEEVAMLERKATKYKNDFNDLETKYAILERSKKAAELEASECSIRIAEATMKSNTLLADKRRLENKVQEMQEDVEDSQQEKEQLEEKISFLAADINNLNEELCETKSNLKHTETCRKRLEEELAEVTSKLNFLRDDAIQDKKKENEKLQNKLKEVTALLDAEQKKQQDLSNAFKRAERCLKEVETQSIEDKQVNIELQHLLDKTQQKMKNQKKELEDAEELAASTSLKYRKSQQRLEEAEHNLELFKRQLDSYKNASVNSVEIDNDLIIGSRFTRALSIR